MTREIPAALIQIKVGEPEGAYRIRATESQYRMSIRLLSIPIRFAVLALATASLLVVRAASEDVDGNSTEARVSLPAVEVVATATRASRDIQRLPVRAEVLDAQEIAAFGATTLVEVLRAEPTITLQAGGSFGPARAAPSLHGASPNATLLLLDGRRLAGEAGGPFELGRIPTSAIERVEIVQGPLGTLYGADAIGGAINVITHRAPEDTASPSGTVAIQAGSGWNGEAEQFGASVAVRGRVRRLGYSLYSNANRTSPFTVAEDRATRVASPSGPLSPSRHPSPAVRTNVRDHYSLEVTHRDHARIASVGGRLDYQFLPALTLGFDFNAFDEDRESRHFASFHPSAWRSAGPGTFAVFDVPVRSIDHNRRLDVSLDALLTVGKSLSLQARVYRSDYRKRNATSALSWADLGFESEAASTTTAGGNADVTLDAREVFADWRPGGGHHLAAGLDHRIERRGGTLFDPAGAYVERSVEHEAFYAQDVWDPTDAMSFVSGLRHDRISEVSEKTTARLGSVVSIRPWLIVRANIAGGFRAPDLRELYIHRQTPAGLYLGSTVSDVGTSKTPHELRPESSTVGEIGIGGAVSRFDYNLTLFRNDLRDRIEERLEAPSGASYRTFRNVARARIEGTEIETGWRMTQALRLAASCVWLDAANRDTGEALTFVPDISFALLADWRASDRCQIGARVRHVGEQSYQNAVSAHTADYTSVDFSALVQLDRARCWEFQLGLENAFDAAVDVRLGTDPGPYVRAGLRHHF